MKLRRAMMTRFSPGEWGLLWEVHSSTGGARRSADAIAMNLWKSRGLGLYGMELKRNRPDWLREKKRPEKAEEIQRYCDYWYLVTEPDVVHDIGEIPETWGWLERKGAKLFERKKAPKLEPAPMPRRFLAALFRRLAEAQGEWIDPKTIEERIEEARDKARDTAQQMAGHEDQRMRQQLVAVAEFEKAAGIKITAYNSGDIGEAVKLAQDAIALERRMNGLRHTAKQLAELGTRVSGVVDRFKELSG